MSHNAPQTTALARQTAAFLATGMRGNLGFYSVDFTQHPATSIATTSASATTSAEPPTAMTHSFPTETEDLQESSSSVSPVAVTTKLDTLFGVISKKVAELGDGNESLLSNGIDAAIRRVEKITNLSQLNSMFHSCGATTATSGRFSYRSIRVQPTALSRRRPGMTRGSSCLPSGRPALSAVRKAKRPRHLGFNISLNRPNAKSHGSGH
ncbi:MAG: hypothetical protein R2772_00020 [Chitinophagales bacterium]